VSQFDYGEVLLLTLKATNVPSVDNLKSSERVDRRIDAVLQLTEPAMLFYTLSMVNHCDTTLITLSNISR
jgi:hypothetical protein